MTTTSPKPGEPAELDALLARAVGHHRAGRLDEAAAAYGEILTLRPDIAEVHCNLGVILKGQGRLDEAVARYQHAIALKPEFVEAYNNLGNALREQGKPDQAAARYRQAVALRPEYAEAHNNLGIVLAGQGQLDQAVASYRQALALRPDFAEAHNNLGNALLGQGNFEQARQCYEQALILRPNYAEAHNNLGSALLSQGRLDAAVARFEQVLALKPNYADALSNLGNALKQQGELDEAVTRFEQALALRPNSAETLNNLAGALLRQDQVERATALCEQALALRPDFAEVHCNLATALKQQGKFDEAVARFEQALTLKPDCADALKNLAVTLRDQLKLADARKLFQRLLALRPDSAEAELGLATCYLLEGDFERGWAAYEARLRLGEMAALPDLPRWTGQPLAGRSLLLVAEQGLGDVLQFVRYARLLKERGARVVLACPRALSRLLAPSPDLDDLFILGSSPEWPEADFYLPLLSAPGALGTVEATIPGQVPYLAADAELADRWRRELAGLDGFKIGIVWQGARDYTSDRWRSIPLAQFAPLARLPGVRLISLQKGFGSEQVAAVDFPVLDLSDRLDVTAGPLMDTAAVIQNVDLVVTPDTAIGHLAGALGAPVWFALQFSPNWRWLRGGDASPWYPTARLFRQTSFGVWTDVFERIANAVEQRRSEAGSSM
ncbi:MAG TPA: tetratricopeptide repeat protein [Pirellulales bacterium]|nr:tetratricopeptide repeat protein [Pirellulales bacterium]